MAYEYKPTLRDKREILVAGIWLRTTLDGRIEVLVEYEDHWRLIVDEKYGDNISHIVEPLGVLTAPLDPVTETEK